MIPPLYNLLQEQVRPVDLFPLKIHPSVQFVAIADIVSRF